MRSKSPTYSALALAVAFLAGLAVGPSPCRAQPTSDPVHGIQVERGDSLEAYDAQAPSGHHRSLSLRGADKSRCSSFLLTEAGMLFPLKADFGQEGEQTMYASVDLGWMTNVSRRSAVGASGFWESGTHHSRGGARLRYRRWLAHRLSVGLSPGVVVQGDDRYDAPGFIGQVDFNAGDLVSVVVEGEVGRYTYTPYVWNGSIDVPGPTQRGSETTWRVGFRGGSYIGLGAGLVAGIMLAALAVSLGGSGD